MHFIKKNLFKQTALARPLIAEKVLEIAKKEK
jgi:hypothetical protein